MLIILVYVINVFSTCCPFDIPRTTLKAQEAELPLPSVAVTVTTVVPAEKTLDSRCPFAVVVGKNIPLL